MAAQSITTLFEVHGYTIHVLAEDGSSDLWASVSFRIFTMRNCNGMSGVIMSENGRHNLGRMVSIHSQLEEDKYFWSPLGNANRDYIRLRFRITNEIVLQQLQASTSKTLEIELIPYCPRWKRIESNHVPRGKFLHPLTGYSVSKKEQEEITAASILRVRDKFNFSVI